jgi:hypothetical protein
MPRNRELTPNYIETAVPATSATGSSTGYRVMRVNPLAGLVDVVEDGLQALVADAGAVLDVAGALEVG